LMVLDLNGRRLKSGRALIVDYLATNPLNRSLGRGLKHVGTAMLAVAVQRSAECGMEGCIWLECLEGAQPFYENLGMRRHLRRSTAGHLVYSMNAAVAKQLLNEILQRGVVEP
jgi:hypothetical protein